MSTSLEAPVTEPVAEGFKGRWGYHPCDLETFRTLKRLHKAFWEHVQKQVAQERWDAKQPQNRQGERPTFCDLFKVGTTLIYNIPTDGSSPVGHWRRDTEGHKIRKVFNLCRFPSKTPMKELGQTELDQISEWASILDKWETGI